MGILAGINADVWLAATPSLNTTNESATDSGDHITYTMSVHRAWDWQQPLTVQNSPNGTTGWVTVTDYTFQYASGVIVFNTARVVGTNNFVRVSTGYYFNLTQLDGATGWSFTPKANTKDTTQFQATGGWGAKNTTTKEATGKIDTLRTDGRVFVELGNVVALQLFTDKTNNMRWDAMGSLPALTPNQTQRTSKDQTDEVSMYGVPYFRTT
jgi:hypothetical protein